MNSNLEIKASVQDFLKLKELAMEMSDSEEELLLQEDIFFCVPQGRLKLRIFSSSQAELIYYERHDQTGPKQSRYVITKIDQPLSLKENLTMALGVKGVVKKKRFLYLVGQTRIHLDQVEDLGDFMELEVVMKDNQSLEEAQGIANQLMLRLGVEQKDLIDCAYVDLLVKG